LRIIIKPPTALEAKSHPNEVAKGEEGLSLEPFFYSATGAAVAAELVVTTASGREVGRYLAQVDGKTGKLKLVEPRKTEQVVQPKIDEEEAGAGDDS
jgi:hypothetical protein